jgi:hypothetical protein
MGEQQGTFGVSARTTWSEEEQGQAVRKYGARYGTIRFSSLDWGVDVWCCSASRAFLMAVGRRTKRERQGVHWWFQNSNGMGKLPYTGEGEKRKMEDSL